MSDYKPITGELRATMCKWGWVEKDGSIMFTTSPIPTSIDAEQSLAISGSDFDRLCDSIDAIHAQLERENAALKAELDRVLGEQEEHAHTRGESITDELREYISRHEAPCLGMSMAAYIRGIADRIDAEHERQLEVLYRDMSDAEYVMLPKDADGEVWHVGDLVVGEVNPNNPKAIERMIWYGPDSGWQLETNTIIYPCPARPRHHHAPTVEDVLRELVDDVRRCCDTEQTIAEYAKRMQLAGDAS